MRTACDIGRPLAIYRSLPFRVAAGMSHAISLLACHAAAVAKADHRGCPLRRITRFPSRLVQPVASTKIEVGAGLVSSSEIETPSLLPTQLYLLCLARHSLGEGGSLVPLTPLKLAAAR